MAAVVSIRCQQRQDRSRFGEHHLLHRGRDLAPARGLLQRRGGAGAVADVGDGDLNGIFVDLDIVMAEDLGADDGVLREILGNAAAIISRPVVPALILMSVSSRKSAMLSSVMNARRASSHRLDA